MAPHSSTVARKIPWMEEPGRLQSMGSLRVGHDWATSLYLWYCWTLLYPDFFVSLSYQSLLYIPDWPFYHYDMSFDFIYLPIFGCAGSSLLCGVFFSCREQGLFSVCGAWPSHCSGFSRCGARALQHRINSRGAWTQLLCGVWGPPGPRIKPSCVSCIGR